MNNDSLNDIHDAFIQDTELWKERERVYAEADEAGEDPDAATDEMEIVPAIGERLNLAVRMAIRGFQAGSKLIAVQCFANIIDRLCEQGELYEYDPERCLEVHPQLKSLGVELCESLKSELKLSLSLLNAYGENFDTLFKLSGQGQTFTRVALKTEGFVDDIFTAKNADSLAGVIHCAGTYQRMKNLVLLEFYESIRISRMTSDHEEIVALRNQPLAERNSRFTRLFGSNADLVSELHAKHLKQGDLSVSERFRVALVMLRDASGQAEALAYWKDSYGDHLSERFTSDFLAASVDRTHHLGKEHIVDFLIGQKCYLIRPECLCTFGVTSEELKAGSFHGESLESVTVIDEAFLASGGIGQLVFER